MAIHVVDRLRGVDGKTLVIDGAPGAADMAQASNAPLPRKFQFLHREATGAESGLRDSVVNKIGNKLWTAGYSDTVGNGWWDLGSSGETSG